MIGGRPLSSLRHLHRDERWIAFASRPLGRVCVFTVAALLLLPLPVAGFVAETTLLAVVLCTLYPAQRSLWLSAAGVCFLGHWLAAGWDLRWDDVDANHVVAFALAAGALIATSAGVYALALREHATARWLARRVLLLWHLLVWGLLLGASAHPVVGTAAVFLCWRVGYALRAVRTGRAAAGRLRDHFYYFWPIWGGSVVPYGKGGEYLRRRAAADPAAIARSQLAGLKLLVLAWGWRGVEALFDAVVYGAPGATLSALGGTTLGWPELAALIGDGGANAPAWQRWSLLVAGLLSRTLEIAVPGHVIVAKLRLFGFNVFRNTYKPLLAESILEFWNRFFYYFKELLVEFFFLPTYARGWKDRPTLRLFVAVFAAAGVGNLYYHLMVFAPEGVSLGLPAWRELLASRGLYCALLATGVFVSMLRERGRRGQPVDPGRAHPLRRVRRIAGVWLFFSLLYIWGTAPVELSFADRNRFLLSLFGVGGP